MGFLKFLKRERKGDVELDLPPAPPPLEGFEESLPELPELPDIEKISAPEDFKFDFPEDKEMTDFGREDMEYTPVPDFPEVPEEAMPSASMQAAAQEPEEEFQQQTESLDITPKPEKRLFAHEQERMLPTRSTIYVRVDKFKATLGSINIVRNDLRKSDGSLTKLETIKSSKDKSFDKVKLSLDDLQKKLIFIDKTLFKGE